MGYKQLNEILFTIKGRIQDFEIEGAQKIMPHIKTTKLEFPYIRQGPEHWKF